VGYDIEIVSKKARRTLWKRDKHHFRGGTYQVGGSNQAHISISYNYAKFFVSVLGENGIRTLYGMSSKESIPLLTQCIDRLVGGPSGNYWEPSEGNARQALILLRELAMVYPDGIWQGD
jgi:hypothetical protein